MDGNCRSIGSKLALKRYFLSKPETSLRDVDAIYDAWLDLHEHLRADHYLNPGNDEQDDYESSKMDVLIANSTGIFGVSRNLAVQQFSKFYCMVAATSTLWEQCSQSTYTATGSPAAAYVNVDASVTFSIHNNTTVQKTARTLTGSFAGMQTASPPLVAQFSSGWNISSEVDQIVQPMSFAANNANASVYSGGSVGTGSYLAFASFSVTDAKTDDFKDYDLGVVNVTVM